MDRWKERGIFNRMIKIYHFQFSILPESDFSWKYLPLTISVHVKSSSEDQGWLKAAYQRNHSHSNQMKATFLIKKQNKTQSQNQQIIHYVQCFIKCNKILKIFNIITTPLNFKLGSASG